MRKAKAVVMPALTDELGYTLDEVKGMMSLEEFKIFEGWMRGQTVPMLSAGRIGFYPWDVKRFLELKRNGTPTFWD